mmetsp:Transcript_6986/g.20515  ORF Transcript_6986/g.20515 Transcript_6986/m.20515 type:complete len:172 (+) Transcript_6986:1760-2275(+)
MEVSTDVFGFMKVASLAGTSKCWRRIPHGNVKRMIRDGTRRSDPPRTPLMFLRVGCVVINTHVGVAHSFIHPCVVNKENVARRQNKKMNRQWSEGVRMDENGATQTSKQTNQQARSTPIGIGCHDAAPHQTKHAPMCCVAWHGLHSTTHSSMTHFCGSSDKNKSQPLARSR